MNKKGFTLIELLVVISIISLLVSILLPSLGKAKELAERSACMSMLNGVGKAWVMYMDSNDGLIPMIIENGGVLQADPNGYEDAHTVMEAMADNVAENGWKCPSKVGKKYYDKYQTSYTYYQPYLFAVTSGSDSEAKLARLTKTGDHFSAAMPIFGDMYDDTTFGGAHESKNKGEEASVVVFWDSHVEFVNANVMDDFVESEDFISIVAELAGDS